MFFRRKEISKKIDRRGNEMKIFISCPFSGILDRKTGLVKEEYKLFFDELISFLNDKKIDYYLSITRENWGKDYISPSESTLSDYKGLKESDMVFVIPGNPISGGVHVELGWASSLQKKIHNFLERGIRYSPVVMGLSSFCDIEYHESQKFPSKNLLEDLVNVIQSEDLR